MLSIIIPTLNEERYLPLLLEAIKQQNFDEGEEDKSSSSPSLLRSKSLVLEIIIADAGSKDKTLEIAKNYDCKIVPGGLPAKGRNEGAKAAKGETLFFMDADNIDLPTNFLKQLLEEFGKRNLDVASFPICPEGNGFDKIAYGIYNWWAGITQNFLPHATSSVLVRKEIHKKIGGFDEEIKIAEDHEFVRRAAKFGRFGFIKTEPVLTSTRRFERDGRFKTYLKYLIAALHMLLFGKIKSNIYNYRFNQYSQTELPKEAKVKKRTKSSSPK